MKLFGHNVHAAYLMLVGVEFFVAALSFLIAGSVAGLLGIFPLRLTNGAFWVWSAGFGLAVVIGMLAMGLYHPRQRLRIEAIMARQIVGLTIAAFLLAMIDLVFEISIPGITWIVSSLICLALLAVVRLGFERVIDQKAFRRRVLVLGAGERASTLLQLRRKSDQRGFKLVAFVPTRGDTPIIDDSRVAHGVEQLLDYARDKQINEIVVAMDDRRQAFPAIDLLSCRFAGIEIVDIVHFLERETGRVKIELVTQDWMIFSGGFTASAMRDFVIRALDLAVVVGTAVVTIPLMILTAIAIWLDDGRPILYRQLRVGLEGRQFTLYKFRSMIKNAEAEGGAQWAATKDNRVTRVGAVLRKYRLDELPQLLNVILGDMSLVGPRPERPEFVDQLSAAIPYYNERHCVKPGITGWAQMSYPYGSSDADAREKLAFDLYYVKHRSLIFNLAVMVQTAEVILWKKGAR